MPKIVDHDERRRTLAEAVWRVISRAGVEGASVRGVAEEAGFSPSGLRHYFDSQNGLLLFAAHSMGEQFVQRISRHLAEELPSRQSAQLILEELLPLDDVRRVEADVWIACLVRARTDSSFADMRVTGWFGERFLCRLAVAHCLGTRAPAGTEDPYVDPDTEDEAADLHTFLDGLTLQAASFPDQLPPDAVRRLLALRLDRIKPGR